MFVCDYTAGVYLSVPQLWTYFRRSKSEAFLLEEAFISNAMRFRERVLKFCRLCISHQALISTNHLTELLPLDDASLRVEPASLGAGHKE